MRAWRALLVKESRAIALPAAAAVAAVTAAGVVSNARSLDLIAILTYAIAPIGLGALVVGHEFTHRTLAAQLTLPVRRWQLLAAKSVVLAAALVAVGAAAHWAAEFRFGHAGYAARFGADGHGVNLLILPLACGFFLAPAFTMLARSTLAGIVFSVAVPLGCWTFGQVLSGSELAGQPADHPLGMALSAGSIQTAFVVACGLGTLGMWLGFQRLSAIDSDIGRPAGRPLTPPTPEDGRVWTPPIRRPVWWRLLAKEMRLQRMTMAVAVLYAIAVAVLVKNQEQWPGLYRTMADGVTYLYALFVAVLAGSLASAEERQLGTLEWQTLLPMAAWKQGLIKVATTFAIALGLGIGVPYAMSAMLSSSELVSLMGGRELPEFLAASVVMTIGGFYVSSLSSSGIRALILSFPLFAGVAFVGLLTVTAAGFVASRLISRQSVQSLLPEIGRQEMGVITAWVALGYVLAIGAFLGWIVTLAIGNHHSAERGSALVRRQLVRIAAVVISAALLSAVVTTALQAMRYGYLLRLGVR
ncbi:MAG TPA: hypothetical protein VFO19_21015 [Vicinamibacterales bacterium]|nr:hypothetical protein [Vicinamibacterales bacterium]